MPGSILTANLVLPHGCTGASSKTFKYPDRAKPTINCAVIEGRHSKTALLTYKCNTSQGEVSQVQKIVTVPC